MEANIDGYEVTLEVDCGTSGCWIRKGRHSASLEVLSGFGVLEDSNGNEIEVPNATIRKIEEWADENGY